MKNHIPISLIYLRLAFGLVIITLSVFHVTHYAFWATALLCVGLISDIFDGIIARRLNVSNERLRRMDSTVDQIFFIGVVIATYLQCPMFFKNEWIKLTVLIGIECLTYIFSFVKFKKEIATHSIGAKIWTLLIFATLIQLIWQCHSSLIFEMCFWTGLATRAEIIAIVLILKNWTNDVPTFFHAIKLTRGKKIKRNKLFNG